MTNNDLHVISGAGLLGLAVMDELVARGRRAQPSGTSHSSFTLS
jgi:hypothetical protein